VCNAILISDGRRRAPVSLCGRDAVQIHERHGRVDLAALEAGLAGLGERRRNEFALKFTPREAPGGVAVEMTIFPDGRAIIKGTTDPSLARSVYARYLGH
jgi:adenylyltransferase/sulfurtransferase